MASIEEDGRQGEEAFARLCNAWNYEYLHIGQAEDELSSEMFRHYEKRPDFLLNVQDVAPIFVEVKAYTPNQLGREGWKAKLEVFRENHTRYLRIRNFERKIRTGTWYAFFAKGKHHIEESVVYMCPVSRIDKWIPRNMVGKTDRWPFISIPLKCMNECSKARLDISDKCIICVDRHCERADL